MWLATEGEHTPLSKDDLFRLLTYHQQAEWSALDRFAQHKNILAGAMIAILAGGGASLATEAEALHMAAFLIPLFVVCVRRYAIDTLDRYYRRFLEAVTCAVKIEFMLGLDRPVWASELAPPLAIQGSLPFESDRQLGVDRHWRTRLGPKRAKGSSEWISKHMSKGHNDVVWRLFRAICIGSAMIPLFGMTLVNEPIQGASLAGLSIAFAWLVYTRDSHQIEKTRRVATFGSSDPSKCES